MQSIQKKPLKYYILLHVYMKGFVLVVNSTRLFTLKT